MYGCVAQLKVMAKKILIVFGILVIVSFLIWGLSRWSLFEHDVRSFLVKNLQSFGKDGFIRNYVEPSKLISSGSYAEVKSEKDLFLWSYDFGEEILDYRVVDLDMDGKVEIIVLLGKKNGDVFKMDVRNWEGDEEFVYECMSSKINGDGSSVGRYLIKDWMLIGDKNRSLLVHCRSLDGRYHTYLQSVSSEGDIQGEYRHPGHLAYSVYMRVGGKDVVVLAGVNDELNNSRCSEYTAVRDSVSTYSPTTSGVAVIFAIDPKNMRGEAPPYCRKGSHGTQLWYKVLQPETARFRQLSVSDNLQNNPHFLAWDRDSGVFYIDALGNLIGRDLVGGKESLKVRLIDLVPKQ